LQFGLHGIGKTGKYITALTVLGVTFWARKGRIKDEYIMRSLVKQMIFLLVWIWVRFHLH